MNSLISRGRIVRGSDARPATLDMDLSKLHNQTFDPARVDAAIEEGYNDGFADGRAEGYNAGLAEGRSAGAAEVDAARRQLGAVLMTLRDQLGRVAGVEQTMLRGFEAVVVDAALALASSVLGRELDVAASPGRDALIRAMRLAPSGAAAATVRLHPKDLDTLGPLKDLALGPVLTMMADESIERGGCIVEMGDCVVDAQLGPALARVATVMRGE